VDEVERLAHAAEVTAAARGSVRTHGYRFTFSSPLYGCTVIVSA
jgi:hypothetical protein